VIVRIENTISKDHSFSTDRDDYVSIWFKSTMTGLGCDNVYAEIGPYAARPVRVISSGADGWHAVCKLSPGLTPQWHELRLRALDSAWSNSVRIPVGVSPAERTTGSAATSEELRVAGVTDGKTWEPGRIRVGADSCLSLWARGIPDGCDLKLLAVILNGERYPAVFLSETDPEGYKQVNAMLPPGLQPGMAKLRLECSGSTTAAVDVELIE
jgi:hypothetical protein